MSLSESSSTATSNPAVMSASVSTQGLQLDSAPTSR